MAFAANKWYAATLKGLFSSSDHGASGARWRLAHSPGWGPVGTRLAGWNALWIASLSSIAQSTDGGATWKWIDLPPTLGVFGVIDGLEVSENDAADPRDSAPVLLLETTAAFYLTRRPARLGGAAAHGLPESRRGIWRPLARLSWRLWMWEVSTFRAILGGLGSASKAAWQTAFLVGLRRTASAGEPSVAGTAWRSTRPLQPKDCTRSRSDRNCIWRREVTLGIRLGVY